MPSDDHAEGDDSNYEHNWLAINLSNTLAAIGTTKIGRKLPGSALSPPLWTDVTLEYFQADGAIPVHKD